MATLTMARPTTGQVEHIMQETRILSSIAHPFVTNKYGAVVTPGNLILIMEFCPGGDLFDQLYRRKHFSLDDVRIFVSQARLPPPTEHACGGWARCVHCHAPCHAPCHTHCHAHMIHYHHRCCCPSSICTRSASCTAISSSRTSSSRRHTHTQYIYIYEGEE